MFGKNEIVGQKYFKEAPEDSLFVTSMFYTLQGESIYAGMPALFIRLAKCNLACSFCDTFFDDGDWLTFDEIAERIENLLDDHFGKETRPEWTKDGPLKLLRKKMVLVMTGGEPSLQKNLEPFLKRMEDVFEHTQIESNGIICRANLPASTTVVVSPKCTEKNGVPVKYIKPNKDTLARADALKFVISADQDSPYCTIPDWAFQWASIGSNRRRLYISPMNIYNDQPKKSKEMRSSGKNRIEITERSTVDEVISFWDEGLLDMDANQANHEYAAKFCVDNGFMLNLQMHLYASLA